jgi:hypothetical protein
MAQKEVTILTKHYLTRSHEDISMPPDGVVYFTVFYNTQGLHLRYERAGERCRERTLVDTNTITDDALKRGLSRLPRVDEYVIADSCSPWMIPVIEEIQSASKRSRNEAQK